MLGGVVIGSLFCLCAALLGVDRTTHPHASARSRTAYKRAAVAAILPILGVALSGTVGLALQGRWEEAARAALTLSFLPVVLVLLVLDVHPAVRRCLRRCGIPVAEFPVSNKPGH